MPANSDPLSRCLHQHRVPLPHIFVASLTPSWRVPWDLVVSSGSTTSRHQGCSLSCARTQPPWETLQAPGGDRLHRWKAGRQLLCSGKTPVGTVWSETVLRAEHVFFTLSLRLIGGGCIFPSFFKYD